MASLFASHLNPALAPGVLTLRNSGGPIRAARILVAAERGSVVVYSGVIPAGDSTYELPEALDPARIRGLTVMGRRRVLPWSWILVLPESSTCRSNTTLTSEPCSPPAP